MSMRPPLARSFPPPVRHYPLRRARSDADVARRPGTANFLLPVYLRAVRAGSPADNYLDAPIDLSRALIQNAPAIAGFGREQALASY